MNIKNKLVIVQLIFGFLAIICLVEPFIMGNKLLYGSGISTQHFPLMTSYYKKIHMGIYPLFDFNFGLGFDSLADSQQSVLHPVKIFITLITNNYIFIDTYFVIFHLIILLFLLILYSNRIIFSENNSSKHITEGALFASFPVVLSLGIYTNLVHIYFIPVLTYGILLLIFIESALQKPNKCNLCGIAISTLFMILCGNFTLQWIIFGWIITYSLVNTYVHRKALNSLFLIFIALAFGFLISAPQLIPTLDIMLSTERISLGRFERFALSSGPFQWFSYLVPGAILFVYEYADNVYGFMTGNNVVEGLHYVGIIPLAAFICALRDKKSNLHISIITITLVLVAQRALGIFSPINILLNYLPIFGQFRASVRYLFVIDVSICVICFIFFSTHFNRYKLLSSIKFIFKVTIIIIASVIVIASINCYYRWEISPRIGLFEFFYIVTPLLILWLARLVLEKKSIDSRKVVCILFIITLADVSFHRYGAPTHWQAPIESNLTELTSTVDRICHHKTAEGRLILMRPENWDNTWYRWDLPIFPNRENNHFLYPTPATQPSLEPNGNECTLTHTMKSSTLTPKSTVELENWLNLRKWNERAPILPVLGFEYAITYNIDKAVSKLTKDRVLELTIFKPNEPSLFQLKALSEFINSQPIQKNSFLHFALRPTYKIFNQIGIAHLLPSAIRKPHFLPQIGSVIALQPPLSFLIFNKNHEEIIPIESKGSFIVLSASPIVDNVEIKFIPVSFIYGSLISLFSLLVGLTTIYFWTPKLIKRVHTSNTYHRSISKVLNALRLGIILFVTNYRILRPVIAVLMSVLIFLIFFVISIGRIHIALQLVSLILFIWFAYNFIKFISKDKEISMGISVILLASHLLGLVLLGSYNLLKN